MMYKSLPHLTSDSLLETNKHWARGGRPEGRTEQAPRLYRARGGVRVSQRRLEQRKLYYLK